MYVCMKRAKIQVNKPISILRNENADYTGWAPNARELFIISLIQCGYSSSISITIKKIILDPRILVFILLA
jgi:hypothetical protein